MRILLIAANPPWPANTGGNQRTALWLRALAELGHTAELMLIHAPTEETALTPLRRHWGLVEALPNVHDYAFAPRRPKLWRRLVTSTRYRLFYESVAFAIHVSYRRALQRRLAQCSYDLVICRYLQAACNCAAFGLAPLLVDIDDVPLEAWWSAERGVLRRWRGRAYIRTRVWPRLRQCQRLVVSKEQDRRFPKLTQAAVVANVPYVQPDRPLPFPDSASAPAALFLATLSYYPNREALIWLLQRVWLRVIRVVPRARLLIAGTGMDEELIALCRRHVGVEPLGPVADPADAYRRAWCALAPIRFGGGSPIKLLEAAAFGRPVVATGFAARAHGNTLQPSGALRVADSAADFARCLTDWLGDADAIRAAGKAAFAVYRSHFTPARFTAQVESALSGAGR